MRLQRLFLAAAVATLLGSTAANAFTPVLTFGGPGQPLGNPPFSLGYEFTTNTTLDVVALGIFQGNGSLVDNHNIDLWDSTGHLLASTTVSAPAGSISVANFDYNSIPEVKLAANSTYFVGADYLTGNDPVLFPGFGGTFSTISNITYVGATFGSPGGFDNFADASNGFFGPNLGIGGVPEPSTWALMLAGIAAMGGALRGARRRQVAAVAA